jgi:hypothetical protein
MRRQKEWNVVTESLPTPSTSSSTRNLKVSSPPSPPSGIRTSEFHVATVSRTSSREDADRQAARSSSSPSTTRDFISAAALSVKVRSRTWSRRRSLFPRNRLVSARSASPSSPSRRRSTATSSANP